MSEESKRDVVEVYPRDSAPRQYKKGNAVKDVLAHMGKSGYALVECGKDDTLKSSPNTLVDGVLNHDYYAVVPRASEGASNAGTEAIITCNTNSFWAVSSSIGRNNYQVPLNKLLFPKLLERAKERGCSLVQGYYRSGKSSHCEALEAYLNGSQDYFCLRISLSVIRLVGERRLSSLSVAILQSIKEALRQHLPPTYDMGCFTIQGAFTVIKNLPSNRLKRMVVLWDEFQIIVGDYGNTILEDSPQYVRQEITEACRALVHPSNDAEVVYSSIGFGTFHLQFLDNNEITTDQMEVEDQTKTNLSPFHRKPPLFMPTAKYDDMKATIVTWLTARKENYDDSVIDAWIENCGGFLGIFSYMGYILNMREPSLGLDYRGWTIEYARILSNMSADTGTFGRMISTVKQCRCKGFIRPYIVADAPISLARTAPEYKDLMRMASAGVFNRGIEGDKDEFTLSCPIVKHLVLHLFSPPSPPIPDELLDPVNTENFLSRLLDQLCTESQTLANPLCWKETKFPTEYTLQSLIFADIKHAFVHDPSKSSYILLMETGQQVELGDKRPNTGVEHRGTKRAANEHAPKKRSDLFLCNGHKKIYELKSDVKFVGVRKPVTKADPLGHAASQAACYAKAQGLNDAVVFNIVSHQTRAESVPREFEVDGVIVLVYQARLNLEFTAWKWIAAQPTINNKPIVVSTI